MYAREKEKGGIGKWRNMETQLPSVCLGGQGVHVTTHRVRREARQDMRDEIYGAVKRTK